MGGNLLGVRRPSFAGAVLWGVVLGACGGSTGGTRDTIGVASSGAESTTSSASRELCAALERWLDDRAERSSRAQAELEAERTGGTPEEILEEWAEREAEYEAELEHPGPRERSCAPTDPGHHRAQPRLAPLALPGGGRASLALVDQRFPDYSYRRDVVLVLSAPDGSVHFEWFGAADDRGTGDDWAQFVVTSLEGDGASVRGAGEQLECVPLGTGDEELASQPPTCEVVSRVELTCTVGATGASCERRVEDVEP